MTDFEIFEMGWKYGWATEQNMTDAVKYKLITEEQYFTITNKTYTTE